MLLRSSSDLCLCLVMLSSFLPLIKRLVWFSDFDYFRIKRSYQEDISSLPGFSLPVSSSHSHRLVGNRPRLGHLFSVYYSLFMMTVHVWNNNIICLLSTKAKHISYFYIPNNLAMTDIETMKTPTHLKNCSLASNSTCFFFSGEHSFWACTPSKIPGCL